MSAESCKAWRNENYEKWKAGVYRWREKNMKKYKAYQKAYQKTSQRPKKINNTKGV